MSAAPIPENMLAAVTAYVRGVMGQSLLSSGGYAQVYASYAPGVNPDGSAVSQPFAVVTFPSETYRFQSADPQTGHYLDCIADGQVLVRFQATTEEQALALGQAAVLRVSDSQISLVARTGRVTTLYPVRADSIPIYQEGVAQPSAFVRVVTFGYQYEFGA